MSAEEEALVEIILREGRSERGLGKRQPRREQSASAKVSSEPQGAKYPFTSSTTSVV